MYIKQNVTKHPLLANIVLCPVPFRTLYSLHVTHVLPRLLTSVRVQSSRVQFMWLYYRGGKGNGNTRMSRSVFIETPKRTSSTIRTETVLIWYFNTNYSTIYSPNDLPAADAAAAIAPSLSPEQTSSEFLLLNLTVQIHPPLSLGTRSFVGEASAAHSFPLHSSPTSQPSLGCIAKITPRRMMLKSGIICSQGRRRRTATGLQNWRQIKNVSRPYHDWRPFVRVPGSVVGN